MADFWRQYSNLAAQASKRAFICSSTNFSVSFLSDDSSQHQHEELVALASTPPYSKNTATVDSIAVFAAAFTSGLRARRATLAMSRVVDLALSVSHH